VIQILKVEAQAENVLLFHQMLVTLNVLVEVPLIKKLVNVLVRILHQSQMRSVTQTAKELRAV